MKKTIFFIISVITLFHLSGQERIEQIYSMYGEHSIVRQVDRVTWMVYSDVYEQTFSMVIDGHSNVDAIYLPDEFTSVSDFTIFQNTVFFCGMRSGVPVMGRFDLTSFPNTVIHYSEMTGVDTLIAIKTFDTEFWPPKAVPRHVVMIGQKKYTGIVVDALFTGGSWDSYYITLLDEEKYTVLHDDIDILDNYVVVASRRYPILIVDDNIKPLTGTGYVWYLKKASPDYAPLLSNVKYFPIQMVSPFNRMRIAACEGETCVATAKAYNNYAYSSNIGIQIYGFENPYNIRTARIADNGRKYEDLKDICYDSTTKKTELLLQFDDGQNTSSLIYTLTQASYPGIKITGRKYDGHKINSLITQTNNSEWFIGSGIETGNTSGLNLYRYKNTGEPVCADTLEYKLTGTENVPMLEGEETFIHILHPDLTTDSIPKGTIIQTVCPVK